MIFKTNSFSNADFFLRRGIVGRSINWKEGYARSDFASPVMKRCFFDVWKSGLCWSRLLNHKQSFHWSKII